MTTMQQIEQRLRAACPETDVVPPPLGAILARIEQAALTQEREHAHWWRRSRSVIAVGVAALVLAGAGGGALLLAPGKPLPAAFVPPANPNTGLGQPIASSLALLPMRVPDPTGGPPWGMRVIRTTRGLVCLQAGRVVGERIGGLGDGYAFNADGRFHPFLPADAIAVDACPAVGSEGLAFLPGPPVIVTADALPLAGENLWPGERVHCDLPGQEDWGVRCPQPELRQVAMGLLGPNATSIEVTVPGSRFTVKPYGREGAYLIVLPAQSDANASISSGSYEGPFGSVSRAPGGAVLTITYSDGSQCQLPSTSPSEQCHPDGTTAEGALLPPSSQVSSPVKVSYVPLENHPTSPLMALSRASTPTSQRSFRSPQGAGEESGPALAVSFTARYAASNAASAYVVELRPQAVPDCETPSLIVSQPTEQTIAAGQLVNMTVPLEDDCATTYSGRVFFASSSSIGGESGGEGPLYETIAAQFGLGPGRNPLKFPTVGHFEISVP